MSDCIFCKIVAGELPSEEVASTNGTYAFRDINPGAPTHVLVVPRQHIADAIAAFQAQPRGDGTPISEATGARPVPLAASLAEMLGDLAAERPRLRIVVRGRSDALTGQLRAVGMDVATVRLAGDPPTTVYVRLDSVSEVSVLGSG